MSFVDAAALSVSALRALSQKEPPPRLVLPVEPEDFDDDDDGPDDVDGAVETVPAGALVEVPFDELPHAASTAPAAASARTARTRRNVLDGPLFIAISLLISVVEIMKARCARHARELSG